MMIIDDQLSANARIYIGSQMKINISKRRKEQVPPSDDYSLRDI